MKNWRRFALSLVRRQAASEPPVLLRLPLAARFADRIIWMKDGAIEADGSPEDTLTEQRLADVFGINATVDGKQVVINGAL